VSQGLVCDACGAALLLDSDVRYVVKIRGYAAYDPMEITREDLMKDFGGEMHALLETMKGRDPQELEDEVHKEFDLDLCPACWKRYIRDPLGGLRGPA
jgi:hypothetical protein